MKTIGIYKIKTEWQEITIMDFLQINDLIKSDLDNIDKVAGIVAILSSKELDELLTIDLRVFEKLAKEIDFIYREIPKMKLENHYKINGVDYTIQYNMNKLTTQQYIDLLHLSNKNIDENIHKILSLFLIPSKMKKTLFGKKYVAEKYGSYDVQEVADIILNNFSIQTANEIMVFFCKVFENLMEHIVHYLGKQMKTISKDKNLTLEQREKLMDIMKDGDGYLRSITLQKEQTGLGIKSGK